MTIVLILLVVSILVVWAAWDNVARRWRNWKRFKHFAVFKEAMDSGAAFDATEAITDWINSGLADDGELRQDYENLVDSLKAKAVKIPFPSSIAGDLTVDDLNELFFADFVLSLYEDSRIPTRVAHQAFLHYFAALLYSTAKH